MGLPLAFSIISFSSSFSHNTVRSLQSFHHDGQFCVNGTRCGYMINEFMKNLEYVSKTQVYCLSPLENPAIIRVCWFNLMPLTYMELNSILWIATKRWPSIRELDSYLPKCLYVWWECISWVNAVSYTHLTLPTIYSV